ncbi:hypothetical protein P3X46_017039 [Hevea brasiliensis]|uniref:SHSP domain-containing protein n=1 Tax=Hevea brasiliensis TaxID=3981 RepID=A0ABQ9M143_HEVBR|nr:hypothetical protein P3X46_017039 [Hevea brasiliensis]
MVFLPSNTTKKEWDNIVVSAKSAVVLTGTTAMGLVGPIVGLMDIGECDDAYLFRVSLPGLAKDETTGEKIVCKNSQIFRMQTQNLPQPGHFSIKFQLPGPVDDQQFSGRFGNDGMLEGIVKKSIQ